MNKNPDTKSIQTNKMLYKPFVSSAKNKKYSVYVMKDNKKRLIHFGDSNMEQYKDKLGEYSKLNHLDPKRRKSYLARAKGIRNKKGELTWKDKNTSNFYSIKYLW
tara:strand:+ start:608 stop:922 length:315 start_codon:yes stop_codon:yes gene_type:complete